MILESVPNFSEGRRFEVIAAIARAAGPRLLDNDPDPDHNRVVLTVGGAPEPVLEAIFEMVATAVEQVDLNAHQGVHPRVGVADVVPLVPLGKDASLDRCVESARTLGERVWTRLRVPVFFYAAASVGSPRSLREIRGASPPSPDLGSGRHPTAGAVCIGVRSPLVAYNVLLPGVPMEVARPLARALRESSGGVRGVQALAFSVRLGSQLSMNLVDLDRVPPATALQRVRELCRAAGVRPGADEVVGLCPVAHGLASASGALLEARLAAAGARIGAAAAEAAGDEEHLALAVRLRAEGDRLAGLAFDADRILAGAESAAALGRVLVAGRCADEESLELLDLAARALRAAVPAGHADAHPARIAALDAWLDAAV